MSGGILSELSPQRQVKNILTVRGLNAALNALHQSSFLLFFPCFVGSKAGQEYFFSSNLSAKFFCTSEDPVSQLRPVCDNVGQLQRAVKLLHPPILREDSRLPPASVVETKICRGDSFFSPFSATKNQHYKSAPLKMYVQIN